MKYWDSKNRTRYYVKGKLKTWMNKNCLRCGRFVTKKSKWQVCSKCAYENRLRWQKEEGRINHNLSSKKYRDKIKALVV